MDCMIYLLDINYDYFYFGRLYYLLERNMYFFIIGFGCLFCSRYIDDFFFIFRYIYKVD